MGWDGPTTWRQYLAWQAWLDRQMNVPSRSDWYAMRTAANVLTAAGAKDVKTEDMMLRFVGKDEGGSGREGKGGIPPTKEQISRWNEVIMRGKFKKPLHKPPNLRPNRVPGPGQVPERKT